MLAMMATAQPAHVERLGVVIVVGNRVTGAANLTGLADEFAGDASCVGQRPGSAALWAEASSAGAGLFRLVGPEAGAGAEPAAAGGCLEGLSASAAGVGWHVIASSI